MNYKIESGSVRIDIETINSDIEIAGAEGEELITEFGDLRKNSAEEVFDISFSDGVLTVRQKVKKLSVFSGNEDFSVSVKIPRLCKAEGEIHTISGDVKVSGANIFNGKIRTKSGDIEISEVPDGDIEVSTISGDTSVSDYKGSFGLTSISGDMSVKASLLNRLNLKSVSGDINLSADFKLTNDCTVNTVSGDIELDFLSCGTDGSFHLKTVSGDIELKGEQPSESRMRLSTVKGDLSGLKEGIDSFSGVFGSAFGSVMKNLKSHIKNVSSDKSDPLVKEEIKDTRRDDMSVQTILNMVSEGKITVDEAEKLIKALK
jgi:lia operon protein LiaG